MPVSRFYRLFVVFFLSSLCSCVHHTKPVETIPYVTGTIDIQSFDKRSLILKGDTIYLIPMTAQSKEFVDAHQDDYYVDQKLLKTLPGEVTTTIDVNNAFTFSKVASGQYYVYWQLPREQGMSPLNRSDPNLFSLFTLTAASNTIRFTNSRQQTP